MSGVDLRKLDLQTLRKFRNTSLERVKQVDKEIDRRLDKHQNKPTISRVPVSLLAENEDVKPTTIVDRCKRADIPVTDKEGKPSRRGATAYVDINLYYEKYSHLSPVVG